MDKQWFGCGFPSRDNCFSTGKIPVSMFYLFRRYCYSTARLILVRGNDEKNSTESCVYILCSIFTRWSLPLPPSLRVEQISWRRRATSFTFHNSIAIRYHCYPFYYTVSCGNGGNDNVIISRSAACRLTTTLKSGFAEKSTDSYVIVSSRSAGISENQFENENVDGINGHNTIGTEVQNLSAKSLLNRYCKLVVFMINLSIDSDEINLWVWRRSETFVITYWYSQLDNTFY